MAGHGTVTLAGTAAGALLLIGLCGWTAAGAPSLGHASAADGRVLQVRYEIRRDPPYAPPPPTEATRLDVSAAAAAVRVDEGVAAAQAADAARSLLAEDARRDAVATAAVRAEDARIDRELRTALSSGADASPPEG